MQFPIYLDYSSTTPVDPRVVESMIPFLYQNFGNPASRSQVPVSSINKKAIMLSQSKQNTKQH